MRNAQRPSTSRVEVSLTEVLGEWASERWRWKAFSCFCPSRPGSVLTSTVMFFTSALHMDDRARLYLNQESNRTGIPLFKLPQGEFLSKISRFFTRGAWLRPRRCTVLQIVGDWQVPCCAQDPRRQCFDRKAAIYYFRSLQSWLCWFWFRDRRWSRHVTNCGRQQSPQWPRSAGKFR